VTAGYYIVIPNQNIKIYN